MSIEKVNIVKEGLNAYYVDRRETIDIMILAIYARKNAFLIGEPGLAKTDILKAFSLSVEDFVFFEYQMSSSTRLEDLLSVNMPGGIGIDNCHIALIDEFFKGNPSVLNSFLSALNERIIYMPEPKKIPLLTVFATSNEKPDPTEGTSLLALYDRFLLRQEVLPIQEREDFKRLMRINKPYAPTGHLTVEELNADYEELLKVNVPEFIIDLLYDIKKEIMVGQTHVSDRRFKDLVMILKASAFLRGDAEIKPVDINNVKSALWTYSSDTRNVELVVNQILREKMEHV